MKGAFILIRTNSNSLRFLMIIFLKRYYGEDRDKRLDDFIIDITYFSGTCYSCELCQQDLQCPKNFSALLSKVCILNTLKTYVSLMFLIFLVSINL